MLMRERSKSFANELLFVHQPGCCWLETGVWLIAPATSASGMPPLSGIPTAPLFLSQHPYLSHNTLISLPAPLFPQHFPPHEGSPAVERRPHLREEHMKAKGPWGQGEHSWGKPPHSPAPSQEGRVDLSTCLFLSPAPTSLRPYAAAILGLKQGARTAGGGGKHMVKASKRGR